MAFTFISLFSGIGGMDLGLERAGMTCVAQVEIDPYCQSVLARHWPDVPRYNNVFDLSGSSLPAADAICGGFPCQPVSMAGRRKGTGDARWLWPEYARLVAEIRPRYVIVENVPGLRSLGGWQVISDLATLGYDYEWDSLSAEAVGAPHKRERFILVAYRDGDGWSGVGTSGDSDGLGEAGNEPARNGAEGAGGDVANPNRQRRQQIPRRAHGDEGADAGRGEADNHQSERDGEGNGQGGVPGVVADATKQGLQRRREYGLRTSGKQVDPDGSGASKGTTQVLAFRPGFREGGTRGIWIRRPGYESGPWPKRGWKRDPAERQPESRVGRVAHGVPNRMDRLRALGNALVPQVAEVVGRAIMEREAQIEEEGDGTVTT